MVIRTKPSGRSIRIVALLVWGFLIGVSSAAEKVTFRSNKEDLVNGIPKPVRTVTGEVLTEAADGGLMLLSDDGRIWIIQPEQIVSRESDDNEMTPVTADQLAVRMKAEMPAGFSV